jgi:hypothetical protein
VSFAGFSHDRGENVEIQIRWLDDSFTSQEGSEGQLRWSTRQTLSAAVAAMVDRASRVLDEYGEEGYLEEWAANPFPRHVLEDLRKLAQRGMTLHCESERGERVKDCPCQDTENLSP